MWIIGGIAYVVSDAVLIATEHVIGTACDVDGVDEAVLTEGIGKVPEGFLMAGGDVVELVADAAYGPTLHLAMQEETAWDGAIADN